MMASGELTCKEFVEIVTDYLEGKLSPAEKARFEIHFSQCDGCHTYLDQMLQTILYVGRLTEDKVPEDAKLKLLEAFRSWKKG